MDMMVEDHETTPEDKTLLPPASPRYNIEKHGPVDLNHPHSK